MAWLYARSSKHCLGLGVGFHRKGMVICKVESSIVWNWKGKEKIPRERKELGYILRYLFRVA